MVEKLDKGFHFVRDIEMPNPLELFPWGCMVSVRVINGVVSKFHREFSIFGSVPEKNVFLTSVLRGVAVLNYARQHSRKLKGYKVKIALFIRENRADPKLVFTFIDRAIDL